MAVCFSGYPEKRRAAAKRNVETQMESTNVRAAVQVSEAVHFFNSVLYVFCFVPVL